MLISIRETSLETCDLVAVESNTRNSTALPLPISAETVRGALESMLLDPDRDRMELGLVEFVRHETSISISCKVGAFPIHWRYLHNIVQNPWR